MQHLQRGIKPVKPITQEVNELEAIYHTVVAQRQQKLVPPGFIAIAVFWGVGLLNHGLL